MDSCCLKLETILKNAFLDNGLLSRINNFTHYVKFMPSFVIFRRNKAVFDVFYYFCTIIKKVIFSV